MLNYFLKKLVGSERSNLAVKSRVEIEFKAKKLVKDICYIYVNLSDSYREEIATAIARDGRSYTELVWHLDCNQLIFKFNWVQFCCVLYRDLFPSAVEVLFKISTSRDEVEGEVTHELIEKIQQIG